MTAPISTYTNYNQFLKDRFLEKKATLKGFSLQQCADRLNISKTFVKMVLDGERNISFETIPYLWPVFDFTEHEKMYFTMLFCYTVASDANLRTHFKAVMDSLEAGKLQMTKETAIA